MKDTAHAELWQRPGLQLGYKECTELSLITEGTDKSRVITSSSGISQAPLLLCTLSRASSQLFLSQVLYPPGCKSFLPLQVKESPLLRVGSFHLLFKHTEALPAFFLSLKENLAHALTLTRNKTALEVKDSLGDSHQHNVFLCISALLISDAKIKEKKKKALEYFFSRKKYKAQKKMENLVFSNSCQSTQVVKTGKWYMQIKF